ncbi:hypothetical protein STEG23_035049 [Scotinomys teguina]
MDHEDDVDDLDHEDDVDDLDHEDDVDDLDALQHLTMRSSLMTTPCHVAFDSTEEALLTLTRREARIAPSSSCC